MNLSEDQINLLWGYGSLILGSLYFVKGMICFLQGKVAYWNGFPSVKGCMAQIITAPLKWPVIFISMFLIHWKPNPKSLIKEMQGLFVMFIIGPMFIFLSLAMLVFGTDKLNLKGYEFANYVLNGFNERQATGNPYILYNQYNGYRFPIMVQIKSTLYNTLSKPVGDPNEHY